VVQPDHASAQIEGGVVHDLSSVLYESITFKEGKVEQSNFNNYNLIRMSDTPDMEVRFVDSYEDPTGLGESSVPLVGGAVANAFAALTGKRLRHLPSSAERVKAVWDA
jgi:isoquinoline 1-oxidoreductase beta subunit